MLPKLGFIFSKSVKICLSELKSIFEQFARFERTLSSRISAKACIRQGVAVKWLIWINGDYITPGFTQPRQYWVKFGGNLKVLRWHSK